MFRRYARASREHQLRLVELGVVRLVADAMIAHVAAPDVLAALISASWNVAVNNSEGQVSVDYEGYQIDSTD